MDFFLDQNNLILVFIAIAAAVMLALPSLLKGGSKAVGVHEAVKLANDQQGVFIDVRSAEAFKLGSIPQARNMPTADIPAKHATLPKDKPLIIVCDQGRESVRAAATLRKEGHAGAVSLEGGLRAWLQAGLPLTKKN
ncbi:rhodanese-like domain-containing protein [Parapusillimonas granuli]|nr:rhodanese-related sulfurtransferase [Parapusillimonas granuli]MEB2397988.1 rhodanese-like domain-containing protein [Alcaligenaceae bacterium]